MTRPLTFLLLALIVCPAAYIALCLRMKKMGITHPPYIPYFFLFGVMGGWLYWVAYHPYGHLYGLFLVWVAPFATVLSSIYLQKCPERSGYHGVAILGGYTYPVLLGIWALTGLLLWGIGKR